jgi:hypothetical protein
VKVVKGGGTRIKIATIKFFDPNSFKSGASASSPFGPWGFVGAFGRCGGGRV